MHTYSRRDLLKGTLTGGAAAMVIPTGTALASDPPVKLPVAGVATVYRPNSHTDNLIGAILHGYDRMGGPGPKLELKSLYVDQFPENDMSRGLAEKFGFRLAQTIDEAVTLGSDEVQVTGVLSIGEHGNYPLTSDTKQRQYPRRQFFDGITAAFQRGGRAVPVFNDKHLAYAWSDAKHIYDVARQMKFPLIAGSSIPVTWRTPPLELPMGCELTEALAIGYGGLESYGFHTLEGLQAMVERRRGGETGVAAVQAVRGEAIEKARSDGRWSRDLLAAAAEVAPPPRGKRPDQISDRSVFYLIEYVDGLRAAVAMGTEFAHQFTFAGRLRGQSDPVATWYWLEKNWPKGHFVQLMRAIDHTFQHGEPAYPVERTLLTTGILDAALHSLAEESRLIKTPHLAIKYKAVDWPFPTELPDTQAG